MEASESDRIKFSNPDDFLIQNLFPGIHRRNRIASQNEVFVTRLVRYVVGRPGRLGSPSVSLGVPAWATKVRPGMAQSRSWHRHLSSQWPRCRDVVNVSPNPDKYIHISIIYIYKS
jgi:hypothetical protein